MASANGASVFKSLPEAKAALQHAMAEVDNPVGAARALRLVAQRFRADSPTSWDAFRLIAEHMLAEHGVVDAKATAWAIIDVFQHDGGAEGPSANGSAPDQEQAPTFLLLSELLERPELLEPPQCVIPRIAYRGRLVVLAGPDKSGKSTLLAHAVAALTRGGQFLGDHVSARHGAAVMLGLEEALGDAVQRFREQRAVGTGVQLVVLSPPDLLERTRTLLTSWPADLVVIDSLSEYARITLGAVPEDGDSAGWAAVVRPLVALARDFDVAVVLLHHVRRSDGQYRGSGEIAAAADAILELVLPANGEDPNSRSIRGRGRWRIEPFRVELRDGRYELATGGELSVDARVLLHVESNPGATLNSTRKAVGGRAEKVDAAIDQLVSRGAIQNRGLAGKYVLYPPPTRTTSGAPS